MALPERVEGHAPVFAEHGAMFVFDGARLPGQVAGQKVAERSFADEADARAVFAGMHRQAGTAGQGANLRFVQIAQREQRLVQPFPRHVTEEIGLVFVSVARAQEQAIAGGRVMARRHEVGAEPQGMVEAGAELHLAVAQHIGVGREASRMVGDELGEHAIAVFGSEVHAMQRDTQFVCNALRVLQVGGGRAVAVVVVPVRHVEAFHTVACFEQTPSGNGGIDASGEAHEDERGRHGGILAAGAPRPQAELTAARFSGRLHRVTARGPSRPRARACCRAR